MRAATPPAARAFATGNAGWFAYAQGDLPRAVALVDKGLATGQDIMDPISTATCLGPWTVAENWATSTRR